jgi:aldose sugar dehydrogenase
MKRRYLFLCLLLVLLTQSSFSISNNNDASIQNNIIARGLGVPWGMSLLPNNTMLISQRNAKLSLLNLATNELTSISGLPEIKVEGQGGLFDVALSPDYINSGWIFFSYNKDIDGEGATTLARAKLAGNILIAWQDLLISQSRSNKKFHYGGRITFDDSGHLFLSIGDRGIRSNAQNRNNHAGSILRLNINGTTPKDNPFIDDESALDEIWSYGHRNPQGLFFNKQTQKLWANEHGPRGGDEINLIAPGKNYGWPVISYGMEYHAPIPIGKGKKRDGMEQPVKYYIPSIAPSSLIQYSGEAFPHWKGDLLAGALVLQHLNKITLDVNNQAISEERLLESIGRIRNIIESPEGWLYIAIDNGQIIRIQPKLAIDNE